MSRLSLDNWLRLFAAVFAIIVIALLVAATAVTMIKPAFAHDFPDPSVLAAGDVYYAYSTASTYGRQFWHVPVARSDELSGGWDSVGDALPRQAAWAADRNVTAPEVATVNGGFVLYFVARSTAANALCIGTALGDTPAGPFQPTASPLVCQPSYVDSIDPQAFTDADGTRYLLYASGQTRTTIWLQRLTGNGLGLVGERRALIVADRPEEHHIVEAPALVRHAGRYLLFYSGNTFNSGNYFVNYATASSLASPFVKHGGEFLNRAVLGGAYADPGGQAVVVGDDQDELVFHASTGPKTRAMFTAALSWGPTGEPMVDLSNGLTHRYAALAAR